MKKFERNYTRDKTPSIPELFELLKYNLKKAEFFTFTLYDYCNTLCIDYILTSPIKRTPESQIDYQIQNYGRFRLMELTKNFGVTFEPGRGVYMSESFLKWHKFWKENTPIMSEEEYAELIETLFSGGDVSEYLPNKDWYE